MSEIEAILVINKAVLENMSLLVTFLEKSKKTELLWSNFQTEYDAVLNALIDLDQSVSFSTILAYHFST